jgi:hypothetical protein
LARLRASAPVQGREIWWHVDVAGTASRRGLLGGCRCPVSAPSIPPANAAVVVDMSDSTCGSRRPLLAARRQPPAPKDGSTQPSERDRRLSQRRVTRSRTAVAATWNIDVRATSLSRSGRINRRRSTVENTMCMRMRTSLCARIIPRVDGFSARVASAEPGPPHFSPLQRASCLLSRCPGVHSGGKQADRINPERSSKGSSRGSRPANR